MAGRILTMIWSTKQKVTTLASPPRKSETAMDKAQLLLKIENTIATLFSLVRE